MGPNYHQEASATPAAIVSEVREAAYVSASEEACSMEEDPREHARRVLLQAHHETQIQALQKENAELRKNLEETARRVRQSKTGLSRALEAQNRKLNICLVLIVVFLFGSTPAAQQFAVVIFQGLMKGFGR